MPTVRLIDADVFRVLSQECHSRKHMLKKDMLNDMLTGRRCSKNSGGGIAPAAIWPIL
jgi:hypothetical protein